eukprot:4603546-Alexandrium_andersonii.AAC.1
MCIRDRGNCSERFGACRKGLRTAPDRRKHIQPVKLGAARVPRLPLTTSSRCCRSTRPLGSNRQRGCEPNG